LGFSDDFTQSETPKHGPAEPSPHLALKSSEKPQKYSFFLIFEGIISKPERQTDFRFVFSMSKKIWDISNETSFEPLCHL